MSHPSSLQIDALAGGLLSPAEAREVRAHLDDCPRCRRDFEAASAACARFTNDVFARTLPAIRARRRWWVFFPAVLVPAFAVIALVWWNVRRSPTSTSDDDIRIKGDGITFRVFAQRGNEVIPVRDGTVLAEGDQLAFVVGTGDAPYLMIASVDGAGSSTIYYPYNGTHSGEAPRHPRELPGSIVLDAALGPERVFVLASTETLDARIVLRALDELGARGHEAIRNTRVLPLPGVEQASIVFEKVGP